MYHIASHKNPGIAHKKYLKPLRLSIPYFYYPKEKFSQKLSVQNDYQNDFSITCASKMSSGFQIENKKTAILTFIKDCHFYYMIYFRMYDTLSYQMVA